MEQSTQFDQSAIQDLITGGSTPSLIPGSLITTLTVGFIVLNVLGLPFLVFYIISMIRKWKVESAVLHMQKDLAEIKTQLSHKNDTSAPTAPTVPAQQNRVIAQETSSSTDAGSRIS